LPEKGSGQIIFCEPRRTGDVEMILETRGLEKYGWRADRLKIHVSGER
jgi:hypothetical protein